MTTTIRPSIWSASMLAGAPEIRTARTWTGLAGHQPRTVEEFLPEARDAVR
jgi:hypothetical protein